MWWVVLQALASKADGCDAADLRALVDRAILAGVKRKVLEGQTLQPGKCGHFMRFTTASLQQQTAN